MKYSVLDSGEKLYDEMSNRDICKRFREGAKYIMFQRSAAINDDRVANLQERLGEDYDIGWYFGIFGMRILFNRNEMFKVKDDKTT